jgi:hypothetical protein
MLNRLGSGVLRDVIMTTKRINSKVTAVINSAPAGDRPPQE